MPVDWDCRLCYTGGGRNGGWKNDFIGDSVLVIAWLGVPLTNVRFYSGLPW